MNPSSLIGLHGWDSHSAAIDLEIVEPLDCQDCGSRRTVRLWFLYEYCTMAWVFGIVSRRLYMMVCDACGVRREVPEDEAKGRQTREVHIPFMRRHGLILIIGLPCAWVAVYFITEFTALLF
jgi:hypothetical protein